MIKACTTDRKNFPVGALTKRPSGWKRSLHNDARLAKAIVGYIEMNVRQIGTHITANVRNKKVAR